MRIHKDIEEIKFHTTTLGGEELEVTEAIVMASAAGWYVGKVCKEDGFVQPYDRFTEYMTQEEAQKCLDTPIDERGFNENYGIVERELG